MEIRGAAGVKITQGASALIQPLKKSLDKRENGGKTIVDEHIFDGIPSDTPARMVFIKRKKKASNPSSSFADDDLGRETINEDDEDDMANRRNSLAKAR